MNNRALERETIETFQEWLDQPETERPSWLTARTAGRPELHGRVEALIRADSNGSIVTGGAIAALDLQAIPERIGAYRITGVIGRGGMGAVYRGERDTGDFTRTVAIKVIKAGIFSPETVRRFHAERQTLATLSHPHIAALYDGGEAENGSPYIVMEFIDGAPLLDWAQRTAPSRQRRLELFGDICAAVAFAHSRLIVHRDLSPANVLVTESGTVKLIDFGIAKPSDQHATPQDSAAANLTVTPGYSAPERFTASQVSTVSDVYSLGRLLDELTKPTARERELKAIIARASAADPGARYPSVEALAADVMALRTRRPVAAHSQTALYAVRKFIGRHTLAAGASVLSIAALVAALVITLNANVAAERARTEAEQRFNETRAIAKVMLFDVFDEVSATAGSTNAREMLARTSLSYLESLAADANAPTDLHVEAGLGFLRLAQVVGGGQASELGRYEDAAALLDRADSLVSPLYEREPQNPLVAHAMGQILLERAGAALYNDNDPAAARDYALRVQEVVRPFSANDAESARTYAVALQTQADTYGWDNNYEAALEHHLAAESFIAGLPPALRDNIPLMRARAANSRLLGEAYHRLDRAEDARAALDRAVALNRAVRDSAPNNPSFIRNLAISTWYRAVVHRSNGRDAEARASIEESVLNARLLRARDANDAGAIRMLAISEEVQAQVFADLGQFEESYATGQSVIAAHRDLVVRAENAPGPRRSLAAALMTHGGNSYNAGRFERACESWIEARDIFRALNAAGQLSEADRARSLSQAEDFVTRACNPPRRGLGERI